MARFLLKCFCTPTGHEGSFHFPVGVQCCNPPPTSLGPWLVPSNTGISPTKELLCEIRCFLRSCHLSPLLMYVPPAIYHFGTSIARLIKENHIVDQKWFFSPRMTCCRWYLAEVHQQEAGGHMISLTLVLRWEKRCHEATWWGRMRSSTGTLWDFLVQAPRGVIKYFLLYFFFLALFKKRSPKSVILQRVFWRCEAARAIFNSIPELITHTESPLLNKSTHVGF